MADIKQQLELEIIVDEKGAVKGVKKLNKGIEKTTDTTKKAEKSQKSFFSKMKAGYAIMGAVLAGVVIKGLSVLVRKASDAQETFSKFNTVFKSVKKEADSVADSFKRNFGLSSVAAKKLLSDTGDLLSGFGFTGKAALDLSKQVNELAVDLASFTNFAGGAEGASAALTKALLGERESVKSLGISILESDVKAKILLLTQQGLTFETNRQAKAYATLIIAQEQSKNAIGDFARTSQDFANQVRILKSRFDDLLVVWGSKLIPLINPIIGFLSDMFDSSTPLEKITKELTDAENKYRKALSELEDPLKNVTKEQNNLNNARVRLIRKDVINSIKKASNEFEKQGKLLAAQKGIFSARKISLDTLVKSREKNITSLKEERNFTASLIKERENNIKQTEIEIDRLKEIQKTRPAAIHAIRKEEKKLLEQKKELNKSDILFSQQTKKIQIAQDILTKSTEKRNNAVDLQNNLIKEISESLVILGIKNAKTLIDNKSLLIALQKLNNEREDTPEIIEKETDAVNKGNKKQGLSLSELNKLKNKYLKISLNESEAIQNQIKDIDDVLTLKKLEKNEIIKLGKIRAGLIDQLKAEKKTKDDLIAKAEALGDAETDYTNLTLDQTKERIASLEEEKEKRKEMAQLVINLAQEGFNVASAFIDRRLQKLTEANEIELLALDEKHLAELNKAGGVNEQLAAIADEAKAKRLTDLQDELDAAILAGDTELAREKENAIKTIKLNTEKDALLEKQAIEKEKLEKKHAHESAVAVRKSAIVDKAAAIFSIAGSTAMGIAGIWGAPPYGPWGVPGKIIRSTVVGGIGIAQGIAAGAKPLPEVPTFALGGNTGVTPGITDTNDGLNTRLSNNENVFNSGQSGNLFNALETAGLLGGRAGAIANNNIDRSIHSNSKSSLNIEKLEVISNDRKICLTKFLTMQRIWA